VRAGIARLSAETDEICGGDGSPPAALRGVAAGTGYFVAPVLRRCRSPETARVMHEHEVFGPVATIAPYGGEAGEAAALVRRGGGGLVASVYSDDRDFVRAIVTGIAAYHGRIFVGSAKVVGQSPGPGSVLPQLVHGGPGRAGGGEELGGLRGLAFYQQRTAIEGDKAIVAGLF
jgi:oxepin-CoA hydrolase/3-oxo-5,6-dehydrosuberyl-CoA semialdehyde dehydrogenase